MFYFHCNIQVGFAEYCLGYCLAFQIEKSSVRFKDLANSGMLIFKQTSVSLSHAQTAIKNHPCLVILDNQSWLRGPYGPSCPPMPWFHYCKFFYFHFYVFRVIGDWSWVGSKWSQRLTLVMAPKVKPMVPATINFVDHLHGTEFRFRSQKCYFLW